MAGTIMGVIIASRTTETQERKKVIRAKIEETYDMLDQTKRWAKLYITQVIMQEKIIFSTKSDLSVVDRDWLLEGINDENRFNEISMDGKLDKSIICPIREIERNANLYIPSIKKEVKSLRGSINSI
jgi:hypothetical protein